MSGEEEEGGGGEQGAISSCYTRASDHRYSNMKHISDENDSSQLSPREVHMSAFLVIQYILNR